MNHIKMAAYGKDFAWQRKPEIITAQGMFFDEEEQAKITVYLQIHREIIVDITYEFEKQTCLPAHASAHYMCEYLKDKPVMEAALFSFKMIDQFFEGLEKGTIHSAIMVEMALKRALARYLKNKKSEFSSCHQA